MMKLQLLDLRCKNWQYTYFEVAKSLGDLEITIGRLRHYEADYSGEWAVCRG